MSDFFVPDGFTFIRELQSGFYGPSYLVSRENAPSEHYICKMFNKKLIGSDADVNQFLTIIKLSRRIKEKFFLPYCQFYDQGINIITIRPFIEGLTLQSYITNVKVSDNLIFAIWKVLTRLYRHLAKNRITPLFIKPSNIFIDNGVISAITDIYPPPHFFNPTLHRSTPLDIGFLAPEILTNKYEPSAKSDIWTLGVLLYYMIVGKLPWNTSNVVIMMKQIVNCQIEKLDELPDNIKDVIASTLVIEPDKRITSELLVHCKPGSLEEYNKACGLPKLMKPMSLPKKPLQLQPHHHSSSAPTSFLNSPDGNSQQRKNIAPCDICKHAHLRRTSLSALKSGALFHDLVEDPSIKTSPSRSHNLIDQTPSTEIQMGSKKFTLKSCNVQHRTVTSSMGNQMMSIKMMTNKK